jgi:EmrB/QacA subfamily drug resistance transporter
MTQVLSDGTAQEKAPEPGGRRLRGHPWLTLFAVAVGVMMVTLDGTIVAVANPAIQADLHASLADVQWITNGYLLALAVSLITAGKVGDRFGHRQTFLVGIVGFGAMSTAIGLSNGVSMIVAFRVLQGIFGALLQPAALGLLRATFPAEKLNTALGIWGATLGASTAAGPIVGGVLVEHVNWQSVFFINAPVGLVALVVGLLILKDVRAEKAPRSFDVPGVALLSGAMFLLIWGLIKAPTWGWGDSRTLLFLACSVAGFVLFALWEARAAEPLVPLKLFRSVPLSAGTALMVLMAFALIGGLFFLTFYLQNVQGLSPVDCGVRMLPLTAMMIVGSPVAGVLITRFGPRMPMVAGMLSTAVAMFAMTTLTPHTGTLLTSLWFALLGIGLSPIVVGATEVIVGNAPMELSGVAGGLQQAAMQVGGSLGTAVLGALMAARVDSVLPGKWAAAKLPPLKPADAGAVSDAASVGLAPVTRGTPPGAARAMAEVSHSAFMSGMTLAFTVAGAVGIAAAVIAGFTRRAAVEPGPGGPGSGEAGPGGPGVAAPVDNGPQIHPIV